MLRYESPAESLDLAKEALEAERDPIAALWIGCELGSSLKSAGQLVSAMSCLIDILTLASEFQQREVVSDSLWRLSLVESRRGNWELAVKLANRSILEAGISVASEQLGRALVARAMAQHQLGRYSESQESCRCAKAHLDRPLDLANLSIAMWHNSTFLETDEDDGFSELDPVSLPTTIRLDYLWVAAKRLPPNGALEVIGKVLEGHSKRENWLYAARAGVEVVRILRILGREGAAKAAAGDLCHLVFKLEHNKHASDCLAELVAAALSESSQFDRAVANCISGIEGAMR